MMRRCAETTRCDDLVQCSQMMMTDDGGDDGDGMAMAR